MIAEGANAAQPTEGHGAAAEALARRNPLNTDATAAGSSNCGEVTVRFTTQFARFYKSADANALPISASSSSPLLQILSIPSLAA